MSYAYSCEHCPTIYDPTSQGHCPLCGRHPHLDDENCNEDCDHDCDSCSSVRFPPKDGYLDRFKPVGEKRWQRVPRSAP